jgi:hypothetical protein
MKLCCFIIFLLDSQNMMLHYIKDISVQLENRISNEMLNACIFSLVLLLSSTTIQVDESIISKYIYFLSSINSILEFVLN